MWYFQRHRYKGGRIPPTTVVVAVNDNLAKSSKYLELVRRRILVSPSQTAEAGRLSNRPL